MQTEKKITKWLNNDYTLASRWYQKLSAYYYNHTKIRWWGTTHTAAKLGMASSAPTLAYLNSSLSGIAAIFSSGGLFIGHWFVSKLDNLSRDKSSSAPDIHADMMLRVGDFLSITKSKASNKDIDDAIRACLGILENYASLITNSSKGQLSVTLALYMGSSTTRMKIKHRNPGNARPSNRDFDATNLMGYHACQNGTEPRVVHDLKKFGKSAADSPTKSGTNYRSFFIIPIESKSNGSIRGFVSIDSPRPYAFYGNRSSVIMVRCEPVLSHLGDLIERI